MSDRFVTARLGPPPKPRTVSRESVVVEVQRRPRLELAAPDFPKLGIPREEGAHTHRTAWHSPRSSPFSAQHLFSTDTSAFSLYHLHSLPCSEYPTISQSHPERRTFNTNQSVRIRCCMIYGTLHCKIYTCFTIWLHELCICKVMIRSKMRHFPLLQTQQCPIASVLQAPGFVSQASICPIRQYSYGVRSL